MGKKVILSADSTCDLGAELKQRYDVNYYPYHIILDGKDYLDNVDITPDDIFKTYYEKRFCRELRQLMFRNTPIISASGLMRAMR